MKKRKPVCDRDCFHCKYKDCIDGRPFLTAFERKCLRGIRYTNGKQCRKQSKFHCPASELTVNQSNFKENDYAYT